MTRKILPAVAALVVLAFAAAGCGGSASTGASGRTITESAAGGAATQTVAVRDAQTVGKVLVDAQGATLYTPAQEANGMISCTGSCTSIWVPLTLKSAKAKPSASGVMGKVGTVRRPDGAVQVTVDGKPLYTFVEDSGPGDASGNGFKDQFGGHHFTWHALTPSGANASGGSGGSGGSTGSSGGYGY